MVPAPRGASRAFRRCAPTLLLIGFAAVGPRAALAQPELVSVGLGGALANGYSEGRVAISRDGRYVAFSSRASNLVEGDTNDRMDVFVRDRLAGITTRVSVSSARLQGDGHSFEPAISRDGRFVAFASSAPNLVEGDTNTRLDVFVHDRATSQTTLASVGTDGARGDYDSYGPAVSDDGRFVLFVSQAASLAPSPIAEMGDRVFLRDRLTSTTTALGFAHVGVYAQRYTVGLSGDGRLAAFCYAGFDGPPDWVHPDFGEGLHVVDTLTGDAEVYPFQGVANATRCGDAFISGDGHVVAYGSAGSRDVRHLGDGSLRRVDRIVGGGSSFLSSNSLTDDGRLSIQLRYLPWQLDILDRRTGATSSLPVVPAAAEELFSGAVSGDGSIAAFVFRGPLVPLDTNGFDDVYVLRLDADGDTMLDAWETTVGLDPTDSGDAAGDLDGDGRTNAEEFAAGTLVNGGSSAYFAEGVVGSEFSTAFAAFNPSGEAVSVSLEANTSSGLRVGWTETLEPGARVRIDARSLGLRDAAFGTRIESSAPVLVERVMTWGRDAHAEAAVPTPSTTWYFAEGATHSGFELFYLLFNPGLEPATTTIRWLRGAGQPPVSRTFVVEPGTRRTVWVDAEVEGLRAADVGAVIESDRPIVAERSMYLASSGAGFSAGTSVAGVVAPRTEWFLAEGATGPFFEMFLPIANPTEGASTVEVTYVFPTEEPLVKTYRVDPLSRFTIWVDGEDARLADTAVAVRVRSVNDVPIVVERAMWWGGSSPATWYAAHASAATPAPATRWAMAEIGGTSGDSGGDAYVLVANFEVRPATIRLRVSTDEAIGGLSPPPPPLPPSTGTVVSLGPYEVPAHTRVNVPLGALAPALAGHRCSVIVESEGADPTPVVVEGAWYLGLGRDALGRGREPACNAPVSRGPLRMSRRPPSARHRRSDALHPADPKASMQWRETLRRFRSRYWSSGRALVSLIGSMMARPMSAVEHDVVGRRQRLAQRLDQPRRHERRGAAGQRQRDAVGEAHRRHARPQREDLDDHRALQPERHADRHGQQQLARA